MALHVGDEVFVTRINSADRKVIFEGKERVTLTSIFMNTSNVSFSFTPDINGSTYFSSRYGDTYERITNETKKETKFKVGDKVKILSKSYGYPLSASTIYKKGGGYGYINSFEDGYISVNDEKIDGKNGDFFLEKDLELVEDSDLFTATYSFTTPVEYETGKEMQELYKSLTNKKMETTKSIVEFAKNLTLSKEEKLLRKANLKDSDGDWTNEARHIVKQKRAKEFGYKSWGEMTENVGGDRVSAIEYAQLFDKYKDELIKIAAEFEKENKKK